MLFNTLVRSLLIYIKSKGFSVGRCRATCLISREDSEDFEHSDSMHGSRLGKGKEFGFLLPHTRKFKLLKFTW